MVVLIGDNNPVHVVTGNGSWSLEFAPSFSTLSKLVLEQAIFIIDFNSVVGSIGHHDQTWFSAVYTPWAAKLTPSLPFWPECGFWHSDFSVVATHANVNLKKKKTISLFDRYLLFYIAILGMTFFFLQTIYFFQFLIRLLFPFSIWTFIEEIYFFYFFQRQFHQL